MNKRKNTIKSIAAILVLISFTVPTTSCGNRQEEASSPNNETDSFVYNDSYYSTEYIPSASVTAEEASTTEVMTSVSLGSTSETAEQKPTNRSITDSVIKKPVDNTDNTAPGTTAAQNPALTFKELQELLLSPDSATTAAKLLDLFGFSYDPKQDIYYSTLNPLQRGFGYNMAYDALAPYLGMYFDTERLYFNYDEKDWLVQIWKGQYGVTVGAEIGIYYKLENSTSVTYNCVSDEDMIVMSMVLFKDGKVYLRRGPERHWWLTGFKLLDSAEPSQLSMTVYMTFDDTLMADAFAQALDENKSLEYIRNEGDFYIDWKGVAK